MTLATTSDPVRPNRGGRPRDPSRDGAIREAILRLLADIGYGALTMDAVAAEAGVGKATIYRRWRSKEDLVVDTIGGLAAEATPPDTGSLEGDVRELMHSLVRVVTGTPGAAMLALLSTVPHRPALAEAFQTGPIAAWSAAFEEVWARAEQRREVPPNSGRLARESSSALLVQRWLLSDRTVDDAYADEVLEKLVLPYIRANAPAT